MVAHADVARGDLDVLPLGPRLLHADAPRDDPVAPAVDRRGRYGERVPREVVDRRRIVRAGQRDHAAHLRGEAARQAPRVDAAQAPADQADLSALPVAHLRETPPETA